MCCTVIGSGLREEDLPEVVIPPDEQERDGRVRPKHSRRQVHGLGSSLRFGPMGMYESWV